MEREERVFGHGWGYACLPLPIPVKKKKESELVSEYVREQAGRSYIIESYAPNCSESNLDCAWTCIFSCSLFLPACRRGLV